MIKLDCAVILCYVQVLFQGVTLNEWPSCAAARLTTYEPARAARALSVETRIREKESERGNEISCASGTWSEYFCPPPTHPAPVKRLWASQWGRFLMTHLHPWAAKGFSFVRGIPSLPCDIGNGRGPSRWMFYCKLCVVLDEEARNIKRFPIAACEEYTASLQPEKQLFREASVLQPLVNPPTGTHYLAAANIYIHPHSHAHTHERLVFVFIV